MSPPPPDSIWPPHYPTIARTPVESDLDSDRRYASRLPLPMTITITSFETTPNPNAIKCWIEPGLGSEPRSYRDKASAVDDPVALALFERAGATSVLIFGTWMTVNKAADADWSSVKRRIRAVLAEIDAPVGDAP